MIYLTLFLNENKGLNLYVIKGYWMTFKGNHICMNQGNEGGKIDKRLRERKGD